MGEWFVYTGRPSDMAQTHQLGYAADLLMRQLMPRPGTARLVLSWCAAQDADIVLVRDQEYACGFQQYNLSTTRGNPQVVRHIQLNGVRLCENGLNELLGCMPLELGVKLPRRLVKDFINNHEKNRL